jgi:hypothetical protein
VWWWVLIWVLLVVLAAAYLGARAWGVWGQLKNLTREVSHASSTLTALETQVDRLSEHRPAAPPDVFGDPRRLRREREASRAALRAQRRARLAARRPGWANHLDS